MDKPAKSNEATEQPAQEAPTPKKRQTQVQPVEEAPAPREEAHRQVQRNVVRTGSERQPVQQAKNVKSLKRPRR